WPARTCRAHAARLISTGSSTSSGHIDAIRATSDARETHGTEQCLQRNPLVPPARVSRAAVPASGGRHRIAVSMRKELATFLLLVVLCVIVTALNPRFMSPANLQNTARLIGAFGIFSLGLGLVIITGGIDLSVGSSFALLGVLLSMMLTEWHLAWPLAVLA